MLKEKIANIAQMEGDRFEIDEMEVEKEYLNAQSDNTSIAIKILSVVGGFLAMLAFLGFLLIFGLYDSEVGLIITGMIFTGAAIWLNIVYKKLIIDTFSVSAYGLGLCLIAVGLSMLHVASNAICLSLMVIAILTMIATKNYILSFVSILIINGGFIFLIMENELKSLIHIYNAILLLVLTYVFLSEAKLLSNNKFPSKLYNPIRIGLMISALCGLVLVSHSRIFDLDIKFIWASSIITIPLTIYVISLINTIMGITELKTKVVVYSLCFLFLVPTAISPAISGSLLIILLCFLVNYKTGLTIGVTSFIYFICQYYYDLNFTLLTKSLILFISGIVFLLLYFFTNKKLGHNE